VGLDVGSKSNAERAGALRHPLEIRFQPIEVQQQRGRGQVFDAHLDDSGVGYLR
jgi:hypothetical protein